jgi:hypothetical protein
MFAPSINVDLEKLQKEAEDVAASREVASKGRARARKSAAAKAERASEPPTDHGHR